MAMVGLKILVSNDSTFEEDCEAIDLEDTESIADILVDCVEYKYAIVFLEMFFDNKIVATQTLARFTNHKKKWVLYK